MEKLKNENFSVITYDIESLDNVFTCALHDPKKDRVTVYVLCDPSLRISLRDEMKNIQRVIYEKNRNFTGEIFIGDLNDRKIRDRFAKDFGLSYSPSVNDPKSEDPAAYLKTRPVCDTDKKIYDPLKHPYMIGYNSYNYDTVMLAAFLYNAYPLYPDGMDEKGRIRKKIVPQSVRAGSLRQFNDILFTYFKRNMTEALITEIHGKTGRPTENKDWNDVRNTIRKNMLSSGRHVDAAKLNESQQRVGLKRLLGSLGYQILESDKLSHTSVIKTPDELYDLIAYNVSDVVNLTNLFSHPVYLTAFKGKRKLLSTYPEVIYNEKGDTYKPDERPESVKFKRLTPDSTAAQFAAGALCPYGELPDLPFVSYMYPSEEKAREYGMERYNVLEYAKDFFYKNIENEEARRAFNVVYEFYKSIEGKNFNDKNSFFAGENDEEIKTHSLYEIPKRHTTIPYFDKDGNPTSCYITLKTGGSHGAEYNEELYKYDVGEYNALKREMERLKGIYDSAGDFLKNHEKTWENEGRSFKQSQFAVAASSSWKTLKKPELFTVCTEAKKKGENELNKRYVYTSIEYVNHEDFKSYYPGMLINMGAFVNKGLGYDRYNEIFLDKERYGVLEKDQSYSAYERGEFHLARDNTKLVLNAASGAADTEYKSAIKMNNYIISMRIIG